MQTFSEYARNQFADRVSKKIMKELFKLPPEKQLEYLKKRGLNLKTDVNFNELKDKSHEQAFTVAKVNSAELLQKFHNALVKTKSEGKGLDDFLKDTEELAKLNNFSKNRMKIIYETNLNVGYAKGEYEQQQRLGKKGIKPYIKYVGSNSREKDELHETFYDKVLPYDDPFWSNFYPPSRFGCKCSARSMSQAELDKSGLKVEKELLDKVVKANGKEILDNPGRIKIAEPYKPDLDKYEEPIKKAVKDEIDKKVFKTIDSKKYYEGFSSYRNSLDDETNRLVRIYTGDGYRQYNGVLRGTIKDKETIEEYTRYTQKMLDKDVSFKLEESSKLFRGEDYNINVPKKVEQFNNQLKKIKAGALKDKAFFSTSTDREIAEFFSEIDSNKAHSIIYTVYAPKGSRVGIGNDGEKEYFFKPNADFIVDSVEVKKKGNSGAKAVYVSLYYVP